MSEKFDIIFRGDIVLGHSIHEVKQRLGQLFKINADKVDALFGGGAVPLKRNVDGATAEKYQVVLAKAGAQIEVRPVAAGKPGVKPLAQPRAQPAAAPPTKKLTLKERLEQQAAEQDKALQAAAPKQRPTINQGNVHQTGAGTNDDRFTLAPAGSDLAEAKVVPEVDVDTSAMTLRPMAGDLLDDGEKPVAPAPTAEAGQFQVAEIGADLLQPAEKSAAPPPDIPVTDFDIAAVGADLLEAAHKLSQPEVEIDTSEFSLAPVGSDMGQQKPATPPPPPDISGIKLAD